MQSKIGRTIGYFIMYWVLFGIGTFFGQFLPPNVATGISLFITVVMLATLIFRIGIPNIFLPFIAFGLGITFYYYVLFFVTTEGLGYVLSVVIMAIVMFATAGVLGLFVIKNAMNWGKYLLIALIALIMMSLVSFFLPIAGMAEWLSMAGLLLFLLYTIYDFNRIRHDAYDPAEMGFALFINLLNIIKDLLYLVREWTGNND